MNISHETVSAVEKVITGNPISGDTSVTPYRTGPELVEYFNQFGADDSYGQDFPSRARYAEQAVRKFNGREQLSAVIESSIDPRRFIGTEHEIGEAVAYLDQFLRFDGYELMKVGGVYRIRSLSVDIVEVMRPSFVTAEANREFIDEQIEKCERKINEQDYDGAITNARSLVEAILVEMEKVLVENPPRYDGNLIRLYKRVQRPMRLDPSRKDVSDSLRQVLSGLISVISGLSSLRNRMGDAHARMYKPSRHHALLVVNASRTASDFLCQTFDYQLETGNITLVEGARASSE